MRNYIYVTMLVMIVCSGAPAAENIVCGVFKNGGVDKPVERLVYDTSKVNEKGTRKKVDKNTDFVIDTNKVFANIRLSHKGKYSNLTIQRKTIQKMDKNDSFALSEFDNAKEKQKLLKAICYYTADDDQAPFDL